FSQVVRQEQLLAVEQGAKSDRDPLWAAPAISEAWCNARLGLTNGNLNRHSAATIIAAVETVPMKKAANRRGTPPESWLAPLRPPPRPEPVGQHDAGGKG